MPRGFPLLALEQPPTCSGATTAPPISCHTLAVVSATPIPDQPSLDETSAGPQLPVGASSRPNLPGLRVNLWFLRLAGAARLMARFPQTCHQSRKSVYVFATNQLVILCIDDEPN